MRSSVAVALFVLCVGFGAWLALRVRAWRERLRGRGHNVRGKQGERDAERLLQAHGYRICERQSRVSYSLLVDGTPQPVDLVLDFIVERGGEQLVAEVKTGAQAPRLQRPETRRQLLEYQLATASRCVLLVDPQAQTIVEVAFPGLMDAQPRGSASRLTVLVITAVMAALASWRWGLP